LLVWLVGWLVGWLVSRSLALFVKKQKEEEKERDWQTTVSRFVSSLMQLHLLFWRQALFSAAFPGRISVLWSEINSLSFSLRQTNLDEHSHL
jgi:hypothetical protein